MSVKVTGLKELLQELKTKPERVVKAVDEALTEGAENIEGRAKILTPVDRGLLRGANVADVSVPLHKEITNSEFYTPYMEFGTGKRYNGKRPEIAAQFRGAANRGNFEDMVKALMEWVKKKGFASTYSVKTRKKTSSKASRENERRAAEAIALSIIRHGVKAANKGTGFFFRAYDEILPSILDDVRKALKA